MAGQIALLGEVLAAVRAFEHFLLQVAAHMVVKLDHVYVGTAAGFRRVLAFVAALDQAVIWLVALRAAEIEKEEVFVGRLGFLVAQEEWIQVFTINNYYFFVLVEALNLYKALSEHLRGFEVK